MFPAPQGQLGRESVAERRERARLKEEFTHGPQGSSYAFDVLQLEGESLLNQPLDERRKHLKRLLRSTTVSILLSEPLPGAPADIEREIRGLGLEGVVAKRRDSEYRPGQRTDAWVKVKFSPRQEFVIGGYTRAGATFDSILVGYYQGKKLYFAARVRAGFTAPLRAEVLRRIATKPTHSCPVVNLPNSAGKSRWGEGTTETDMATMRWVKPTTVVEVAFVEWTAEGLLRHAQFIGVREDKRPSDVQRENLPR